MVIEDEQLRTQQLKETLNTAQPPLVAALTAEISNMKFCRRLVENYQADVTAAASLDAVPAEYRGAESGATTLHIDSRGNH